MQQPTRLISTPFAQEGEKTEIQNVTGEFDNSATYRLGFPPLTMQSIRLGGKPPKGTDFNGVLFDITENISFLCKGGRYQYNAGLSTLIGGYPEGSNLLLDDNVTEVVSTVASNQNNPNTNMTGWILKPNKTTAVNVADASGETQQQVNYNGGSKWHSRVGGYQENERVVLANGDIVKSTVDVNVNDPNVDMTGWFNESSFVEDKTKSFLDFGAKGDGVTDDSISIGLASTWSSMYKRKVSGLGKEYKCSNVFFDSNCYLADAKLINNANADLISVLTTAVSRDWLENVTFENIHIDGKRIDQTGVKDSGLAEDGGRHGFRFRRPCKNIRIRKSSANFCASDGICLFPDMFNGGDVVSIIDFVIEDSEFNWNRRHGGSSDRTNGLTLINTKCNFNGRYLDGYEAAPQNSGAQGDKPYQQNFYYGNGWDSEEYDNHTYSSNLSFINCEMIDNAKGGLLILAYAGATAINENIKIIGGRYNKGVLNTQDDNSISLTPNSVTNTSTVYKDVVIASVTTRDAILLRNVVNYSVTGTPCNLTAVEYSQGYYDGLVASVNGASTSKNIQYFAAPSDKYTYNQQFNIILAKDVKTTRYDSSNAGIVHQWQYLLGGDVKGAIIGNVKPDDNTVSVGYRMDGANEQLRVESFGVTMLNAPSLSPANIGDITITPISNTRLALKYKGSDGIVRSATLALS